MATASIMSAWATNIKAIALWLVVFINQIASGVSHTKSSVLYSCQIYQKSTWHSHILSGDKQSTGPKIDGRSTSWRVLRVTDLYIFQVLYQTR